MTAVKEAHVRRALESNNGNKRSVTSAALAKALSDIGVNEETIQLRRTTWLYNEAVETIYSQLQCHYDTYYFGSQSEGSTTEGMDSDYDCLGCQRIFPVIQNIVDRQCELAQLFLVTDKSTPPQCCCLQLLLPYFSNFLPGHSFRFFHFDALRRKFLKSNLLNFFIAEYSNKKGCITQHGPALTVDNFDSFGGSSDTVHAFHCAKLPENCQYIFKRPKPGHWPGPELVTQLKDSGVFLVPNSPVQNTTNWDPQQRLGTLTVRTFDNSHELYWRLSTNLMERLLMFDITMTQMKVYVIMKIIRKEFFKPLVGDRLSTFHLKTTFLYCVEMSPPGIWKDENLIQCLKYCLTTLRRWLKMRYCPHYTTVNVNLFAGKLQWNEFPVLIDLLKDMILNDVSCLYNVKMDDLGNRISSNSTESTNGLAFEELNFVVASKMFYGMIYKSICYDEITMLTEEETSKVINDHAQYIQKLETIYETSTVHMRSAVSIKLPFQYSIHAAMKASLCIGNNQSLPQEIFTLCDKSLMSDVTSSRLKLASIYFSARRFEEAAAILKQVDALISDKVIHVSPFIGNNRKFGAEMIGRRKEFSDILQKDIAVCTIFSRNEINCVPGQLVAEFYRTVTVENEGWRRDRRFGPFSWMEWMDLAVVDSLPYMYYLQFLIFRSTGLISDKDIAFKNLFAICKDRAFIECHIETTLNLIGHCYELEGKLKCAWRSYKLSVKLRPQNNAAYWHMFRMIGGLFYGVKMLS
ncbi:uncharacterized protein LOC127842176 [Dreissena polymorpha]|uniref:Mab-21-like HhH/H2TH-like domain-containing protein n=1 Tax=Dreissena polymorpha TaxID=45954 RepID=A0A9D4EUD3_DREPO|nr:uncharacterized protein LOC127842176 [Dreissena polymorpha]KAH3784112.1 hypothetical protein DPMN_162063 [Dreissena polymorpha]